MPTAAMSLRSRVRHAKRFGNRGALRVPDLECVVFDPAGSREVLGEFVLGQRDDPTGHIEQQ